MAKTEILGSWFPSGYHGHFRSKSRTDFHCEYRHLAKPAPPKAFNRKLTQPASKHLFSRHDNRQSFLNDALIFQEGLGKRRIANETLGWKPELLYWMPQKTEISRQGPLHSDYKVTYRGAPRQEPLQQQIIHRPKTSFDDNRPTTTSYRYAHGKDNPNRTVLNAMSNVALAGTQQSKRQNTQGEGRENVAMCLNWYVPERKMSKPLSTQTLCNSTMLVPSPPSAPKPSSETAPAPESTATASVNTAPSPPAAPKQAFD